MANASCAVTGTYEPRPSRRISQLDPAGRIYVREGRRFEVGLAGDAEDLVSGNDLAVRTARRAHRQTIAGLTLYGIGLASMVTGLVLLVGAQGRGDQADAGRIVIFSGLVPLVVSGGLLFAANRNRQDAVNIYNDTLEGPLAPDAF